MVVRGRLFRIGWYNETSKSLGVVAGGIRQEMLLVYGLAVAGQIEAA